MRVVRIFDNGDGTVTVERDNSFNTLAPMAAGELARIDVDLVGVPETPDCERKHWAWDGAKLVEAGAAVKAQIDAAEADARAAAIASAATADMDESAAIRACVVEDYADYAAERNAINTLANRVLGAGTGPRLPVETLADYGQRRKDRYKAILEAAR